MGGTETRIIYKRLTQDIVSRILKDKKPVVYGKQGDKVQVIYDKGNVLIVENEKKERFPVQKDKVI
jgi:hypothetical protein